MVKNSSKKQSASREGKTNVTLALVALIVGLLIIGFKLDVIGGLIKSIFILGFLSILLAIAFVRVFYNNSNKESNKPLIKIENSTPPNGSKPNDKKIKELEANYNALKKLELQKDKEISELKSKNQSLEEELEKSKSEYKKLITAQADTLKSIAVKETPQISDVNKEQKPLEVKIEQKEPEVKFEHKIISLFFDGPYEDRLFAGNNAAIEKRFRYVYRIEYNTNQPSIGKLHLEPTMADYDILRNFSDTLLKPACTFENSFYSGFTNINQLAPGIVQKQGNDWAVKEKVRIKFI